MRLSSISVATLLRVASAIPTTVDLGYAQYNGKSLDAGVNQYLGIRFAAPPVGDLRFRAPVEPEKIAGVQDANSFGKLCLGTDSAYPSTSESEDCLFINVFTPSKATKDSNLPVWFFIQGGGYKSNMNPDYNGTDIIRQSGDNVVVVNFNYRTGAYGFLASEKVRKDGDLNAGLLDMRMALKWVQKHIKEFGGNPNQVVIHGSSAGAGSVAMLMLAYGGRNDGLFHGGIGTSPFFPVQSKVKDLEWQFDRFAAGAGCKDSHDQLQCLRSKDTATLQAAHVSSPYPGRKTSPLWYFTPTVDGDFLRDYPYRLIQQGRINPVPTIWGDETDEGTYFAANATTPQDVTSFMADNYPRLTKLDNTLIDRLYPRQPSVPKHNAYFPSASDAYGESTFICGGLMISGALARHHNVWNYRYGVLDETNVAEGLGVPHTWILPAVFGVGYAGSSGVGSSYEAKDASIVPVVKHYHISFVRTLNPNKLRAPGTPVWDDFSQKGQRLLLQTNATGMENIQRDQVARCAYWTRIGARLEQ
ncbi:triacylglycerol lipase-like protein [Pyronema domesticum]|nr:triacylglycerol lipase-like protein [Pyronema domesticum]